MRVVSLFSGGKDSNLALEYALSQGWDVIALLTIVPSSSESYMFHHPDISFTSLQAEVIGIRHVVKWSKGEKEELNDLLKALTLFQTDGVVAGAVASEYQKERIEAICEELGLKSFTPLWHVSQEKLLEEIVKNYEVIITSVSAEGLGKNWLGRRIDEEAASELMELSKRYGFSVCGEGGEFETFVLNAPFYKERLKIIDAEIEWRGQGGVYKIKKMVRE